MRRELLNGLISLFTLLIISEFERGVIGQKRGTGSAWQLLEKPKDVKEFKKLMRTKTNVLVLFSENGERIPVVQRWLGVCAEAAEKAYGKGTVAFVDCGEGEGKKLCKKLKVSPSPVAVKHFHNGEFHKDYDRLQSADSMTRFLMDPTGDMPWEEDSTASDVLHIPDGKSLSKVLRKGHPTLIMFYAPWCGYCKRLKPDYASAATDLKASGRVLAAMDVTRPENSEVQRIFNITGFPTLLYFENGKLQYPFGGQTNKQGLVDWMKDPSPAKEEPKEVPWEEEESDVVHLTDQTFHSFLSQNPSVLVMFYAPWCGHCKRMKPEYTEAARLMKAEGVAGSLAAVDATQSKSLGEQFAIKGFPTVKYFKDGQFAWDYNERTGNALLEFMRSPTEPPPPPPPEVPWTEEPSDVIHLNADNFKSELKRKKHALVMFYAPWCGHCKKAKPEFSSAASHFQPDPKVAFAALDCTAHNSVCEQHEVQGFPTVLYFNYGKNPQPYNSLRDAASFISYMTSKSEPPPEKEEEKPKKEEREAWEWSESVAEVSPESFESLLAPVPRALLLFYAPWCPHCKRIKPIFGDAASQTPPNTIFAAVDCSKYSEFCKTHGVKGYPSFKVFRNGVFSKDHSGGRTKEDFLKTLGQEEQRTEL